jgi:rhodanese-related sulfurtransferase
MRTISLATLQLKLKNEPQSHYLLDVREAEEYEQGHIPLALLTPWHTIQESVKGIKKDRELILYCNTRVRALKAAKSLEDNGFTNVAIYPGGWEEWSSS